MNGIFAAASAGAYELGAVAAIVHLVISWWLIVSVLMSHHDAQWQLIWIFLLLFDLLSRFLSLLLVIFFQSGILDFLRLGMTLTVSFYRRSCMVL